MIIALTGEKRVGKDYLTNYMVTQHGANRLSFSDTVRDIADELFPWLNSYDYLHDDSKDKVVDHPKNVFGLTPRQIWIKLNELRLNVDPTMFLDKFIRDKYEKLTIDPDFYDPERLWIITDMRMWEEHQWIASQEIPVIKIVSDKPSDLLVTDAYVRALQEDDVDFVFKNEFTKGSLFDFRDLIWEIQEKYAN